MSQEISLRFDQFYYGSLPEVGQQILAGSITDERLHTALRDFVCRISFSGYRNEERFLFCPVLGRFCKVFIRRDGRGQFFHLAVPDDAGAYKAAATVQHKADHLIATLTLRSDAAVIHETRLLPKLENRRLSVPADSLCDLLGKDARAVAALLQCAFAPFMNGGIPVTMSVPYGGASDNDFRASDEMLALASLLLLLLPDSLQKQVRLRFSAEKETYNKSFDCSHLLLANAPEAVFDLLHPVPSYAIAAVFEKLGTYIAANGLTAYRKKICPILENWVLCCSGEKELRLPLLELMLAEKGILPAVKTADVTAFSFYFTNADADWFDLCGAAVGMGLSSAEQAKTVRSLLLSNVHALAERGIDAYENKEQDGYLALLAASYVFAETGEKTDFLHILSEKLGDSQQSLSLLRDMKMKMHFTFALPEKPTPTSFYEGLRVLEADNPAYAQAVTNRALDAYFEDGNDDWLGCINKLYKRPSTAQAVLSCLLARFETLLEKTTDKTALAWFCGACAVGLQNDKARLTAAAEILLHKHIAYDDLLVCIKALQLREEDLPSSGPVEPLAAKYDSLQKLSELHLPTDPEKAQRVRESAVSRLAELLAKDCTWEDIHTLVPAILNAVGYLPATPMHLRLETLLCRQLVVLAPDVLTGEKEHIAYARFLVQMRKDFCLRLYPATNAADLSVNNKSVPRRFLSAVGKVLPWLLQCAVTVLCVMVLFVQPASLPQELAPTTWQTIAPYLFAAVGAVLVVLHLVLRKKSLSGLLLSPGLTMLTAAVVSLVC